MRNFRSTLVVLGLVALARTGHAQDAADDPETKAARARFKEGVEFFDKKQYDNARAAFRQAYALRAHPSVLLNLAMSSLKGGHSLEAARYFNQWMREVPTPKPADKKTAETGLADARKKLALLDITGPAGTDVFVGADRIGTLPLTDAVDVEPGESVVRWTTRDGITDTLRVQAAVGARVPVKYPEKVGPSAVPVNGAAAVSQDLIKDPAAPAPPPGAGDQRTTEYPAVDKADRGGLFDRPESLAPVFVGAGVAVAGFATAVVFTIFKGSAQSSADSVDAEIRTAAARRTPPLSPAGICVSSDPRAADFKTACSAYQSNLDAVNANVTVANVSLGVGAAGALFALGWYMFAPKQQRHTSAGAGTFVSPITVSPWLGGPDAPRGMRLEARF